MKESSIEVTENGKEIVSVESVPPIAPDTIARTVIFVIAWVNELFAYFGLPVFEFDQDGTYQAFSILFVLGWSIWMAWKDNAFTIAARISNAIMKVLKKEEKIGKHAKESKWTS